ncbi:MAG: LolA family protein [Bdellovibrionales bacterium]
MNFLKKTHFIFLILSYFISVQAFSLDALEGAQAALNKIKGSPLVVLEIEKTTKSELMGTESKSEGTIFVSSNRFRWDTSRPEESSIIYDGKTIWTIQIPPKGFKMPAQVTKMKLTPKSEGQIFLSSLFNSDLKNQFKSKKTTKEKVNKRFYLEPTQKNQMTHALEILVSQDGSLKEIAYNDEIENRISVSISKIEKKSKIPKHLFNYTPPKGAQVSEL